MAKFSLTQCAVLIHEHEITDASASVSVDVDVDTPESTNFGSGGWREFLPGLKQVTFGVQGQADYGADLADDALFSKLALTGRAVSIIPGGATEGNVAFSASCVVGEYSGLGGSIGDVAGFQLGALGDDVLVNGTVLHYGQETNNHDGTAFQLGAAASGIYAALHVLSGSGSLVVKVQSDDNAGFTTPTDRITFATVGTGTPRAAEWASLSGAITDDYWRMTAAFTGTRKWAVVLGVI